MIVEGIKLAIIGILIVYTFLFLLILVMHLSTKLLSPYTKQEVREEALYKRKSSVTALLKDGRLAAVISAAVSAHRRKMQG